MSKSMSYDHPAYTAVRTLPTGQITGASGVSTKYAAFTSEIVKSVVLGATTINTSAEVMYCIRVQNGAGTNTTTNTYTMGTWGSGAYYGSFAPTGTNIPTLNQGDVFWIQKAADATGTYVGQVEIVTAPLANVTT